MLARFDGEANLLHVFKINGFISFPDSPTATVEFISPHGPLGSPTRSLLEIRRASAWYFEPLQIDHGHERVLQLFFWLLMQELECFMNRLRGHESWKPMLRQRG